MKIKFIFTIFIIVLLTGCNTTQQQNMQSSHLSQQEKQQLNTIDPILANKEEMIYLKQKGYLSEFIEVLYSQYESEKNKYMDWQIEKLEFWKLDTKETVADLETKAQAYLDKYHSGMKIGDNEFKTLVDHYMDNPNTPTAKKAREESEFGALYSYMSLYKQFATNDASEHLMNKDIYDLTLLDICENDFKANFKSQNILDQFLYDKGLHEEAPKQLTTKK